MFSEIPRWRRHQGFSTRIFHEFGVNIIAIIPFFLVVTTIQYKVYFFPASLWPEASKVAEASLSVEEVRAGLRPEDSRNFHTI